ncbi:MAG: dihydropteroate synthase [Nitrospira sp.]|nr:dihydropteroate synthase [Nitrospira sp.]
MEGHVWLARGRHMHIGARPLIMGIVNVTPDSFSDGGQFLDPEKALAHAMDLAEQGADIVDLGAESTRPGASPVDVEVELKRIVPLVASLAKRVAIPISVDTMKARVAQAAIDAGASIVNDVSGLRFDPEMASIVARTEAGLVLMHMQGMPEGMQQAPQYEDVATEVCAFFKERLIAAEQAGISKSQIVLDPGIGFGKLQEHNVELLNRLSVFSALNLPILVGLSRKAFLGKILDRPVQERMWGTAAAVALAVDRGAAILRVHDVAEMLDVVKVAAALKASAAPLRQEDYA